MSRSIVLALLSAGASLAGVPNTFSPGQAARSEEVNKNFSYLDSAVATKATQAGLGTVQLAVTGLQGTKADQAALDEAIKLIASKVGSADLEKALKGKVDTSVVRALAELVAKKADADQLAAVKGDLAGKSDTAALKKLSESVARKADSVWVSGQIAANAPSGMLASGKNLSDLADKAAARANLGLGALAVKGSLAAADVGALAVSGGSMTGKLQVTGLANIGDANPALAPSAANPLTISGKDWIAGIVQSSTEGKGASWAMMTPSNSGSYWGMQKRDDPSPGATPGGFVIEDGSATSALSTRFPLSIAPGESGLLTMNRGVVVTGASGQSPAFDKFSLNVNGSLMLQNMSGKQGTLALEFKGGPNYHSGSIALLGISNTGDHTDSLSIVSGGGKTLFSIADATGDASFSGTVTGSFKGAMVASQIKAENVADYVFEPDYRLAPLSEVESYTKEHKHLPEVPSAKEIEANGLDLAQMNLVLLKKVEELTLHTIELEKRLKAVENRP